MAGMYQMTEKYKKKIKQKKNVYPVIRLNHLPIIWQNHISDLHYTKVQTTERIMFFENKHASKSLSCTRSRALPMTVDLFVCDCTLVLGMLKTFIRKIHDRIFHVT